MARSTRTGGVQGQSKGSDKSQAKATSKRSPKPRGKSKRRKSIVRREGQNGYTYEEITALIGHYFCDAVRPGDIPAKLKAAHGIIIHPKSSWRWIAEIAADRRFTYYAFEAIGLRQKIKQKYPFLTDVNVVATTEVDMVATHGARFIFELLRQMVAEGKHPDGIHLGIAGGRILRSVMRALSQQFINVFSGEGDVTVDHVPDKLILHALGAGFNIDDPTTDPNAMFTRFLFDASIPVQTKFVALHAPPIVKSSELEGLKKLDGIAEAYERRNELDIVLTGLGTWKDETGLLRRYMEKCEQSIQQLNKEKVLGDLCWRPVGANGIIETETRIRAMTLLELNELADVIQRGGKVALFCGPGAGGHTKTEVLKVILANPRHLVNYLILDSRTAGELVA